MFWIFSLYGGEHCSAPAPSVLFSALRSITRAIGADAWTAGLMISRRPQRGMREGGVSGTGREWGWHRAGGSKGLVRVVRYMEGRPLWRWGTSCCIVIIVQRELAEFLWTGWMAVQFKMQFFCNEMENQEVWCYTTAHCQQIETPKSSFPKWYTMAIVSISQNKLWSINKAVFL